MTNQKAYKQLMRICGLPKTELFLVVTSAFLLVSVFIAAYWQNVYPFYPRAWDQNTFIADAYKHYFAVTQWNDRASIDSVSITKASLCSFKGCVREALAFIAQLIFGPNRISLALTNLGFLLIGLGALYVIVRGQRGRAIAAFTVGLTLFISTSYMPAGGLMDLRWDFAGAITFGIFVLSLWRYLHIPSSLWASLVVGTFVVTLSTRSISAIYASLLLAACLAGIILAASRLRDTYWPGEAKRFVFVVSACAVAFFAYTSIYWVDFKSYYLAQVQSGEKAIRLVEQGATNGIVAYYAESFWQHFANAVYWGGLTLALIGTYSLLRRLKPSQRRLPASSISQPIFLIDIVVPFASAAIVFAVLSSWTPNPAVIGVLMLPVALLISNVTYWAASRVGALSVYYLLAPAALFGGIVYFALQLSSDPNRTVTEYEEARRFNKLYEILNEDMSDRPFRAAWMTLQEATFSSVFDVWRYEHGFFDRVPLHWSNRLKIFSIDEAELVRIIQKADAVIVRTGYVQTRVSEVPFEAAIRLAVSKWKPIVEDHFTKRWSGHDYIGPISYYLRSVRIAKYSNPNGVEYWRDPQAKSQAYPEPFMWLDERFAELTIENITGRAVAGILKGICLPGPSYANSVVRNVEFIARDRHRISCEPGSGEQFSVPLQLQPGSNHILLRAIVPDAPRVPYPSDARHLVAMVRDLTVSMSRR